MTPRLHSPEDVWIIAMLARPDCPTKPPANATDEEIDRARDEFAEWAIAADPDGAMEYGRKFYGLGG